MSIQITITDPTRDEALRLADYLFDLAGYGKTEGVTRKFETSPVQVGEQLKAHIETLVARTPVEQFIDEAGRSVGVVSGDGSGTVLPPLPPAAPTAVEFDSAGHAWDERIHASSHAVVSDGTWRLRRNLDPAVLDAVLAERTANVITAQPAATESHGVHGGEGTTLPAPVPGAWPFPSDVPPPPPPAANGIDTGTTLAPVVTIGVPPPPVGAPSNGDCELMPPLTFAAFMQRVTAALSAGTIAQTDVAAALAVDGVASIPLLASVHADKIDAIAARLGV